MEKLDAAQLTNEQIRVRVYEFGDHFSAAVEQAADEIMNHTSDPIIRRQALLWKMHAIPASHKAIFHSDPVVSLIDIWALCVQMVHYFTEGVGKNLFGQLQPIAIRASEHLIIKIKKVANAATGRQDTDRADAFFPPWIKEHPIQDHLFTRVSTTALLLEMKGETAKGAFSSIVSLDETASIIAERMTVYSAHMPKQARWEAELLYEDLINSTELVKALGNVDSHTKSIARLASVVEQAPDMLRQDLKHERMAAMKDIETIAMNAINKSSSQMKDLIDHAFLRGVQLTLFLGALLLGCVFIIFLFIRKKP